MAKGGKLRKVGLGCGLALASLAVMLTVSGVGKDLVNLWKNGTLQAVLMPGPKRQYTASNEANLRAMHTALMLYHDSEGQFPAADGWMDAIKNRLKAYDLASGEAEKKLIRPDLAGKADAYGYAINTAAAGKYKDDVGGPKTPFIYESHQTTRNASGDPQKDRDGWAIAVDGTILKGQ